MDARCAWHVGAATDFADDPIQFGSALGVVSTLIIDGAAIVQLSAQMNFKLHDGFAESPIGHFNFVNVRDSGFLSR
ncbi:MAG: hypothetical protein U1F55_14095 [Chitinivorax sp.]